LKRNHLAIAGLVALMLLFLIAIVGVLGTSGQQPLFDPSTVRLPDKLKPPLARPTYEAVPQEDLPYFGRYLLGTDDLGRDVFARMLQGAIVSLSVGFIAVSIAVFVGVFLGGIAGYYGETRMRLGPVPFMTVDTFITGLIDIWLCFPSFFLILTAIAVLPPSIWIVMIIIGLTTWVGPARFVRAELLSLREQEFVLAAKALGMSDMRLMVRHLIPNAMAPVLVSATIGIASAILIESGLSYLGLGPPPPSATWGNILSDGTRFLFDAPWLTYIPGLAILGTVLAFNLFGEGLRDAMNPKLRGE
jgi:peptide/nickel transport system permease protein